MGFGGVVFYYALLAGAVLLMALRVGRSSTGMGIATFLCWPLAVIPLMTNWGVRGSDIRLHFAVALFATSMGIYKANQAADQLAVRLSDEDIAMIRESDPQTAAEIERRQLRAGGVNLVVEAAPADSRAAGAVSTFATISVDANGPSRGGFVPPSTATRPPAAADGDMEFVAAPRQIRKVPLSELHFRRGQVRLGQAFAILDVPEHFRFVSAQQLGTLAETRGVAIGAQVLGWLVHERVDLNSPTFWFVEVQFDEAGHLAAPPATQAEAGPAGPVAAVGGLDWDADEAVAIWSSAGAAAAADRADLQAAKLLRHGAVVYRVPDLDAGSRELGLRAARLMAHRTHAEPGWTHAEFTAPESAQSLQQWIAARSTAPDSARADSGASAQDAPRRP